MDHRTVSVRYVHQGKTHMATFMPTDLRYGRLHGEESWIVVGDDEDGLEVHIPLNGILAWWPAAEPKGATS